MKRPGIFGQDNSQKSMEKSGDKFVEVPEEKSGGKYCARLE